MRRGPATRRRETTRPLYAVLSGLAVFGVLLGFALFSAKTPSGIPGVDYFKLSASVEDSANLRARSEVRIAGTRVGQVLGKRPLRNGRALVELQLDPSAGAIPEDTQVFIRARGLLGQRFLELVPGKSDTALKEGATVQGSEDSLLEGIPEVLNTFDAPTRKGLGQMIDGLGEGVLGRSRDLNVALGQAPGVLTDVEEVAQAAVRRTGAAARLLPALDSGMGALDDSRADITGLIDPATVTLDAISDRGSNLQATLEEAPPTLRVAEPVLAESRRLLASARELATAASGTLPPAPAALRATNDLLRDAREPLRLATPLLAQARAAVPPALGLLDRLDPRLPQLRAGIDDLRPTVQEVGAHGCDIDEFADNWRSVLGFGGQSGGTKRIGPLGEFRLTAVVSGESITGAAAQPGSDATVDRNPYPEPCAYPQTQYTQFTSGFAR